MTQITYKRDGATMLTPCPNGGRNGWGGIMVNSGACGKCRYFGGDAGPDSIYCGYHKPSSPCDCRTAAARMSKDTRGCKI